jgi:hypothetical protein
MRICCEIVPASDTGMPATRFTLLPGTTVEGEAVTVTLAGLGATAAATGMSITSTTAVKRARVARARLLGGPGTIGRLSPTHARPGGHPHPICGLTHKRYVAVDPRAGRGPHW